MRIAAIIIAMLILLVILPIAAGGWFSQHDSVSSSVCTDCHKLDEIGILTTTGLPIYNEYEWQRQLHQSLSDSDCVACHKVNGNETQFFEHGLLNNSIKNKCALCHIDLLPDDEIHLSAGDGCGNCHSPSTWSDVSFVHGKYFVFDRNHPDTCSDCHLVSNDFSQYSCYGTCHVHSETALSRKHREVDNYNYEDCAECHRSGHDD